MAELSYTERMAKDAAIRAKVLYHGRPDPAPQPRVFVEGARRRDVEKFAARLKGFEPAAPQERVEFARMDASAMLVNLSGGNDQVLAELQTAILNQDMAAFVDVMDKHRIGGKPDRSNLRSFLIKQDREGIAACLRMITRDVVAGLQGQTEEVGSGQADVGMEVANRSYPLMNLERCLCSTFLTKTNVNNPAPFRRPAYAEVQPEMLSVLQLGKIEEEWERDELYQPVIMACAKAASDLMTEAAGYGHFDGRLDGGENPYIEEYFVSRD